MGLLFCEEARGAWRLGIDAKFTTDTELPLPSKREGDTILTDRGRVEARPRKI
jgi:hypothetical protein